MNKILFIILISLNLAHLSYSQTLVSNKNENHDLTPSIEYYLEPNEQISQKEALKKLNSGEFTKSEKNRCLNFGTHSQPVWIHITLTSLDDVEKILHYSCAYIYFLDVYQKSNNQNWVTHSKTGKKRDFFKRGKLYPTDYAWDLKFKKGERKELLLRVETRSPLLVPITLESIDYYTDARSTEHFLYGIYFGILIIMMLYNLIIYFSLREKAYIYYILSILCTVMIFSSSNGYSAKYLFPNSWQINYFLSEIFMCLILGPTAMFAITFLDLKKYSKFAYYLMKTLALISIPSMVFVIIFEHSFYASTIVAILAVSLLTAGVIALIKGNPYARYYVIAWTGYLVGGFLITLRNLGHLPSTFLTDNGAEIGSAFEVCLLAFALANKYRSIRLEKRQIEKDHLALIENQKEELEKVVQERTTKLIDTVEELNTTLAHLSEQQIELEQKNQHITSSINYALKIQEAIFPDEDLLHNSFKDYMQLYLPKDIVSGDFIFHLEDQGLKYFAIVDCTGHGVPGAILGMLGYNLLYEIIKVHHIKCTDDILHELDKKLTVRLQQSKSGINDGMDISLIMVDTINNKVMFSGAMNPILIVNQDGTNQVIKGTKRSISDIYRNDIKFDKHTMNLNEISWIYTYSDGFQDQFGGQLGKKYLPKRLQEFLTSNSKFDGQKQSQELNKEFTTWKAKEDQIDDVTVAGVRLN